MKRVAFLIALSFTGCTKPEETGPSSGRSVAPAPARMRRLLARQYVNSVRDLFGDSAAALANPPADVSSHGFQSVGAGELSLTDAAVYQYELSARAISAEARANGALASHLPRTRVLPVSARGAGAGRVMTGVPSG